VKSGKQTGSPRDTLARNDMSLLGHDCKLVSGETEISATQWNNSATSLLSQLYWLLVNNLINSKMLHLHTSHLLLVSPLTEQRLSINTSSASAVVNHNLIYYLCHVHSSFRQGSFSYCAPKICNDIPLSLDSFNAT